MSARPRLRRAALGVAALAGLSLPLPAPASAGPAVIEQIASSGLPAQGTVYAADLENERVVKVLPDGTVANVMTGVFAAGVAVDRAGDVFATDLLRGLVVERHPDGTQSTVATRLTEPTGLAIDAEGDLFVAFGDPDQPDGGVIEIEPDGRETLLPLGDLTNPTGVAVNAHGDVFVSDRAGYGASSVWELTSAGQVIRAATGLDNPWQIALDGSGNLFVADGGNDGGLTKIDADGQQSTVPGTPRTFGVAVDPAGDVYYAGDPRLARIAPDGTQTTLLAPPVGGPIAVYGWAPQHLAFTSHPDGPTVGGSYRATADGGASSRPVVFSAASSSTGCTVTSDGKVTYVHASTCAVAADQTGDGDYSAAPTVTQTFTVAGLPQSLAFTSEPDQPRVGQTYRATATGGGSGEPVVFAAGPSSRGCSVSAEGLVRMTHAQPCVVTADQTAGGDYEAAPQAVQIFSVSRGDQSVTFSSDSPGSPRVGDSYRVTANGGGSGQPVVFSADASSTGCTVTAGGVVTMTHTGSCLVEADQNGDADYGSAPAAYQGFSVGPALQALVFTSAATHPEVGASYVATAQGGASGEPVVFSADPSGSGCTVTASGFVTMTHAQRCVIAAVQAGNVDYSAAPRTLLALTVAKAHPTLSFTTGPTHWVVGRSYQVTAAAGGSGGPVVFSAAPSSKGCLVTPEGVVTTLHARSCVIAADQAGDDDFADAPQVLHTFVVDRAKQPLWITSRAPKHPWVGKTYRPRARGGGSGHRVQFAVRGSCSVHGSVVTFDHVGRCTVVATQQGGVDWLPGSATQVIKGIRRP